MAPKPSTSTSTSSGASRKVGSSTSASASTSKKASGSSSSKLASSDVNGKGKGRAVNGSSSSKGKASASGSGAGRMAPLETLLHEHALRQPKRIIMQTALEHIPGVDSDKNAILSALNSLMRKHLFKVAKNARGETGFVAVSKSEAKELGAMDPEEKLVLDHIGQTTNQGIWIRTLKAKSGLHQTSMNRAIKALEQRKLIKTVKSVKFPTRKIYMLESMVPSIDITGGPWYQGNELDTEFISNLTAVAKKFIRTKSFPDGRPELIYPLSYVPYLPTANDVLEYMTEKKVLSATELNIEHIEMVLNVLVWDGEIERIWARRYSEDGEQTEYDLNGATGDFSDVEEQDQAVSTSKKRKKSGDKGDARAKQRKKKRRRAGTADSDDIDADSAAEDSDVSTDSEVLRNQMSEDENYDLPPALAGKKQKKRYSSEEGNSDDDETYSKKNHRRPGPAGNAWYWVYRTCLTAIGTTTKVKNEDGTHTNTTSYAQTYELGFLQTPCGICPISEFCYNREQPKVLPLPGEKDLLSNGTGEGNTGWEDWKTSVSTNSKAPAVAAEKNVKPANKDRLKELALLKMKVPAGSGEMEDADGNWKGGGKVGGKVVAPVNPANCRYYAQWFGEEFDW